MNPIWFVPSGVNQSPLHHYSHIGKDLFKYRTPPDSTTIDYRHPIQWDDIITIQFEENNNGTPVLTVHDEIGNTVYTVPSPTSAAVSGNLAPDGSQFYTYQWVFRLSDFSVEEQNYSFKIVSSYSSPTSFVSEPYSAKEDHPNTLYFRYHNSINDHDTLFQYNNFDPLFAFRVYGKIDELQPDTDATAFDEQEKDLEQLNSSPFRTHRLFVGGDNGVPDWVLEKLNWIWACDETSVDGILFVKEPESKWEIKRLENYFCYGVAASIREKSVMTPYRHTDSTIALFTVSTYPVFIQRLVITQGVGNVTLVWNQAFYSSSDFNSLVTTLNNTTGPFYGLGGTFAFGSGVLSYTQGSGENYSGSSLVQLLDYFKLTVNIADSTQPYQIAYAGAGSYLGVDWGDNSRVYLTGVTAWAYEYHTYASTGNKTIHVFWDGNLRKFGSIQNNSNKLTNIEEYLPSTLTELIIQNQNLTTLAASLFTYCTLLGLLHITSSNFDGFGASIFAVNTSTFPNLDFIILNNNNLSGTYIDSFIVDMVNDMNISGGGILNVSSQTPSATVNTSATEYTDLVNAGWTIYP
jgi:hypothetical protein